MRRDGNNTPTVSYTRGHDLSGSLEGAGGIGGLLARSHGYSGGSWTNHNFYHADGGGNITYLMTSAQGLAARYRYDPYGRLLSSSGPLAGANLYRFSSKELNPNYPDGGGYYYFGYRFYDPNLQRWLNRDPLGEAGGINLYGFVGNDPLNAVDPLGLQGVPALDSTSANPVYAADAALTIEGVPTQCLNLSSKLARNLAQVGRGVPKGNQAHHIVAGGDRRAKYARKVLERFKIDIDDAANGVGLPERLHRALHTNTYYDRINELAKGWKSRDEAIKGLKQIADELTKMAQFCQ